MPTITPHQRWNVCGLNKSTERDKPCETQLSFHVHTSKVGKTILPTVAITLSKGAKAFRPSELYTKKETHKKMKERTHSEEGTQCSNCNKNRRIQTGQLKLKRTCPPHSFFLYFLSPHPCPSTVRERLLFAVTVDFPSTQSSHSSARESS